MPYLSDQVQSPGAPTVPIAILNAEPGINSEHFWVLHKNKKERKVGKKGEREEGRVEAKTKYRKHIKQNFRNKARKTTVYRNSKFDIEKK